MIPDGKEQAVQGMFTSIAQRYDLNNSLLSLGWHHAWKRRAVQLAKVREGMTVLDLCTGTADIAIRLTQQIDAFHRSLHRISGPRQIRIIALDLNERMLTVGREKIANQGLSPQITCLRGNAEWLQFKDQCFDLVTVAFGIRNLDHIPKAFTEIYRVLKPEGQLICLEFSRPPSKWLQWLYNFYSFRILPCIGTTVSGDKTGVYQYLPASIRQFPDQEGLKEMIHAAGFGKVEYLNLTGGIVAIHSAWR
jgi:demethylmenaquinone methyltransferase/2-methoxy-6-polyprenyl-1,4-benzoquinol methylase